MVEIPLSDDTALESVHEISGNNSIGIDCRRNCAIDLLRKQKFIGLFIGKLCSEPGAVRLWDLAELGTNAPGTNA
ncbi:MAG: hypothetical protein SAqBPW_16680 [Shewanella algae]